MENNKISNIDKYAFKYINNIMNSIFIINKGLKRNISEKIYTSKKIAEKCIMLFKQNVNIDNNDCVIEPSAGDGVFIKELKSLFNNYEFYDLKPENKEIKTQDYLKYNYDNILDKNYNKICVFGNPPFGRQSSLAIKFIKQSCNFCDILAFILPKSFKKDSLKKHFPLNFHNILEYDIPKNSFIIKKNNKYIKHDVPCVFQIWKKESYKREKVEKKIGLNYEFIKKEIIEINDNIDENLKKLYNKDIQNKNRINYDYEIWKSKFIKNNKMKKDTIVKKLKKELNKNPSLEEINSYKNRKIYERFDDFGNKRPDISFKRVGGKAGSISKNIDDKSHQSHNFIKFKYKISDTQYKRLSSINFASKNNTVGPRSISKQELIKEFNMIL